MTIRKGLSRTKMDIDTINVKSILVYLIILQAKFIRLLLLTLKKGNATSLPGLIVEAKLPWVIGYLSQNYKEVVVISGTNGKTTTRSILNNIYKTAGFKVCTNLGGANIYRGIATAMLLDQKIFGGKKSDLLILEIEEATLPKISKYLKVDKLILTNLFRDQLDLYGEIDKTLHYFQESILELNHPNFEVIINADDGKLISLIKYCEGNNLNINFIGFSLDIAEENKPKYELENIKWPLKYVDNLWIIQPVFKLWQGENLTSLAASQNKKEKNNKNNFRIIKGSEIFQNLQFTTNLEGNYNLYNCIAAIASCRNISQEIIQNALASQIEVFGRGEEIQIGNSKLRIILVKNPASFDQVLDFLSNQQNIKKTQQNIIFLINDKIADGKDVSWLWDISFEKYLPKIKEGLFYTGGSRGLDMLLRLEYAGAKVNLNDNFENYDQLLETIQASSETDYNILCTYTAMTELREILSTKVVLKKINDESF